MKITSKQGGGGEEKYEEVLKRRKIWHIMFKKFLVN
jgi:hypothetical protein